MRPKENPKLGRSIGLGALIAGITCGIIALCVILDNRAGAARSSVVIPSSTSPASTIPQGPGQFSTPMIMPAFQSPSLVQVGQADLKDESPVVAVRVGDEARAYSIAGMSGPATHVVNDFIDDTAITVAYCDVTDCVRVFGSTSIGAPLSVSVAGFMDGQMAISLDGNFYRLDAELPIAEHHYERTTWGEWKKLNPDSHVFVGGMNATFGNIQVDRPTFDPES